MDKLRRFRESERGRLKEKKEIRGELEKFLKGESKWRRNDESKIRVF